MRLLFACIYLAFISHNLSAQTGKRPNIIFVLADDLGWMDISAYRQQMELEIKFETPMLDSVVKTGMAFMDAHSPSAVCSPTRFSLMTGCNPYRNGRRKGSWGLGTSSAFTANADKRPIFKSIGDVLSGEGYFTSFFGKEHLGGEGKDSTGQYTRVKSKLDYSRRVEHLTSDHGFEYAVSLVEGIQNSPLAYFKNGYYSPIDPSNPGLILAHQNQVKPGNNSSMVYYPENYIKQTKNGISRIGTSGSFGGLGDKDWNSTMVSSILLSEVENFLVQARTDERPFFMYFSSQALHVPHSPAIDMLTDESGNPHSPPLIPIQGQSNLTKKEDMIIEFDSQLQEIIRIVDSLEMLENTIVIVTSDNGGLKKGSDLHNSMGPLRGHKGLIYEGGHRVPFIVNWGGLKNRSLIQTGFVEDPISNQDYVATLLGILGIRHDEDQFMDSHSFLPKLFNTQSLDSSRPPIIIQSGSKEGPYFAVRYEDWVLSINDTKGLTNGNGGQKIPVELNNLSNDLSQVINLIDTSKYSHIADSLFNYFINHDNWNDPATTRGVRNYLINYLDTLILMENFEAFEIFVNSEVESISGLENSISVKEDSGTLKIQSILNKNGDGQLVVNTKDGTFVITIEIQSQNSAPIFELPDTIRLIEDFGVHTEVDFINLIQPFDERDEIIEISIGDSLSFTHVVLDGLDVTFTSVSDQFGSGNLVIEVSDSQYSIRKQCHVIVESVNDPPSVQYSKQIELMEDFGHHVLHPSIDSIFNEEEVYSFAVETINVNPAATYSVDSTGLISFQSEKDKHGLDSLLVTISDGQDFSFDTLYITVVSVPDSPIFEILINDDSLFVDEDFMPFNVIFDFEEELLIDTLILSYLHDSLAIKLEPIHGGFTVSPIPNVFGSTNVIFIATNEETSLTHRDSIALTINPINDPPVYTATADTVVNELPVGIPITFWDIERDSVSIFLVTNEDVCKASLIVEPTFANIIIEEASTDTCNVILKLTDNIDTVESVIKVTISEDPLSTSNGNSSCVYPNPVNNAFTISCHHNYINIFDSSGRRVEVKKIAKDTYDVSWLPRGLYYLEIDSSERRIVKLIVDR